jgi:hypothetical protein
MWATTLRCGPCLQTPAAQSIAELARRVKTQPAHLTEFCVAGGIPLKVCLLSLRTAPQLLKYSAAANLLRDLKIHLEVPSLAAHAPCRTIFRPPPISSRNLYGFFVRGLGSMRQAAAGRASRHDRGAPTARPTPTPQALPPVLLVRRCWRKSEGSRNAAEQLEAFLEAGGIISHAPDVQGSAAPAQQRHARERCAPQRGVYQEEIYLYM